jgi:hypothetical protein
LRSVGQEIASLGAPDPRTDANGNVNRRSRTLLKAHANEDPPAERVKPTPIQLVTHAAVAACNATSDSTRAIADCAMLGFFFLLRPGEHTHSCTDNHPFRLQDASFFCDAVWRNAAAADLATLHTATQVPLNFTAQKNGEENEAVAHDSANCALVSPVKAVLRRVTHLRHWHAAPATPLRAVCLSALQTKTVTSGALTNTLRASCAVPGPSIGIRPADISARALRAGGAMALLRARADPTVIQMVGRWKSWTMIRCLHKSAAVTTDLASRMMIGGNFSLTNHAALPEDAITLLAAADAAVAG